MITQTIITAAGNSWANYLANGFKKPKSLLEIEGKSVIQRAIESYTLDFSRLSVALSEGEVAQWETDKHVRRLFPDAGIVRVADSAQGALASALLASSSLDLALPLVVAAGDSQLDYHVGDVVAEFQEANVSAGTIVFPSSEPRWSFVAVDSDSRAVEVSEKQPISNWATTGFFYFCSASSFIEASRWVLLNNARVLGRFYVSTVLNFMISRGELIGFHKVPASSYRSYSLPSDFVKDL